MLLSKIYSKKGTLDAQSIFLLVGLIIYLIAVTIFISSVGDFYGSDIEHSESEQSISTSFIGNITTGISMLPVWLNAILFIIPVALIVILVIKLVI